MSLGSRKLGPMSAEDKARRDLCVAAGCEACHQLGLPKEQHCGRLEYHHFTDGGFTIAHRNGCCLGLYHHQGTARPGWSLDRMREKYDTNLRDDKSGFHARFGSQQALQNGQDDRIGWPREEIPSHRELRLRDGGGRRKPSRTARPTKLLPPRWQT